MKKLRKMCILFLVLLTTTAFLHSEEMESTTEKNQKLQSPHEVYFGIGYPNSIMPIFVGGMQDILTAIFTGGKQGTKLTSYGATQLGYNWYCIKGKGLSVGALFTAEPYKTNYIFKDTPENNYEEITTMFTIQATAKYQYGWKYVRLYHGVSIGLGIVTIYQDTPSTSAIFAFNIIPIGIKAGKEQGLNFYADIGIGSTPVINAGAAYRF